MHRKLGLRGIKSGHWGFKRVSLFGVAMLFFTLVYFFPLVVAMAANIFVSKLCEKFGVERKAEFSHCRVCEVRRRNLALKLTLKECKEKQREN